MEKIKQALERAREESQSTAPNKPGDDLTRGLQPDLETEIRYSQTRVSDIDERQFRKHGLISGLENDEITTAYKILRTQVEQRMVANEWNTLAVTSPNKGEGKTLTAINLAISLAREVHRTVLLVDLDLRNPNIHQRLGQSVDYGVAEYLLKGVPVPQIMFNPGIERLVVLPGKEAIISSSELLASPRMEALVDELKTRYPSRFVIFDLPPLLSTDDALAFVPNVDAVLLVVEDGMTSRQDLSRAHEMLRSTNILGTVLNKTADIQNYYY